MRKTKYSLDQIVSSFKKTQSFAETAKELNTSPSLVSYYIKKFTNFKSKRKRGQHSHCKLCGKEHDRKFSYGFCVSCYQKVYSARKSKLGEVEWWKRYELRLRKTCINCDSPKVVSLGRCNSCYNKFRRLTSRYKNNEVFK